ncbi:LAGLIDADG family homing endonuclease [Nonomuraea sp. NPDC050202]|uniref:LAGLIDADG family homing endonuclease n=1 Tax=Nonomuraea sp. NPDC050202 TaxID=3155035 RepID=UPI003403AE45
MSGGIGSFWAAKRVAAQHGTDNLVLLFADTLTEDEDLYRFMDDASAHLGVAPTIVQDGRTPFEVFFDVKWLGNSRLAPCSKHLKQVPCRKWMTEHCDPADTIAYVGFDHAETRRLPGTVNGWSPWRVEFPMCSEPHWDKDRMLDECRALGIAMPRLYDLGYEHNNCLHPDTRFITDQGIKTLRETCGQTVRVLGRGGAWREATIKSFGEQPTYELRLRRYDDEKTVVATADHLWPIRLRPGRSDHSFGSTAQLQPGDRIAGMYGRLSGNVRPSTVGIMAGFTFGDGTAPTPNGQVQPARAYICGDKDKALLPYFAGCRTKEHNGVIRVLDLPRAWKQPPPLDESQSYLYGWLAGYFAADGSVSKGTARISSATIEHLELVKEVAGRLGIAAGRIRTETRTGYGTEPTPLHSVALTMSTLREDFFLIPQHRERFLARESTERRPADWTVVEVVPTGRVEEVMCAVVPDGRVFTLEDNLLTHNCGGVCVRAGREQWLHTLEVFPDRYAEAERQEQEFRDHFGKDVSILTETLRGEKRPLTLAELRRRHGAGLITRRRKKAQPALFDTAAVGC